MCNRLVTVIALILMLHMLMFSALAADFRLALVLDDINSPVFEARQIQIQLAHGHRGSGWLDIDIAEIKVHNNVWENVNVSCRTFHLERENILCTDGRLNIPGLLSFPVTLHLDSDSSLLKINVYPTKSEDWQFTLHWDQTSWQGVVAIHNGQLNQIVAWLPDYEQMPKLSSGKINGTARLEGDWSGLKAATVDMSVVALTFADQAGLHAGEDITIALKSNIVRSMQHNQWHWQSDLYWQDGEIFWQPVYMTGGGHHLSLQSVVNDTSVRLLDSSLILSGIGAFNFSGLMSRTDNQISVFKLAADKVESSALFDQILKPFLRDTSFAEMEVTGHLDLALRLQDGALQSISLGWEDGSIIDSRDRFAFHRIYAHIPWRAGNTAIADISMLHGHVLHIPLGAVRVPLEINKFNLFLPQLALPVLDGVLRLEDFSAAYTENGWQWKFNGELLPVSMETLTTALQIQQMHGTLSGYIPEVRYDGNNVTVNGVLQVNIFDGSVVVHKLMLIEPMGLTPHFKADIAMRDLDLELLTRTFSFGKMEGRIDIDLQNLELANWQPVHFDARLFSSPGNYSRRISQTAIKNISALGGEGAAVAIQRSFLRFFEEFRYSEIGWRCALRLDICYMGGIEPELQSSYTLVKGGGIPAITVMGYNQEVGWQELVDRLQRITLENEPIIQ